LRVARRFSTAANLFSEPIVGTLSGFISERGELLGALSEPCPHEDLQKLRKGLDLLLERALLLKGVAPSCLALVDVVHLVEVPPVARRECTSPR
jgi:hypothetical protein